MMTAADAEIFAIFISLDFDTSFVSAAPRCQRHYFLHSPAEISRFQLRYFRCFAAATGSSFSPLLY
jgi:hypothetical protein